MYAYHQSSWGWFGDSKVATEREQERRGSDPETVEWGE